MFKKILLPLDGTELAEVALPYGEEMAGRLGAEVMLYHVQGREHEPQEHMHQVYLDRLAETVRSNISRAQNNGPAATVSTKVESGEPSENICNIVDENKVDLIVMTAVSTSGLKIGKMLGSVADHICRTVPVPVLLVRPKTAENTIYKSPLITHLFITLDGSELSKMALPVGTELAASLNLRITLFQMANMLRFYDDASGSGIYIDYTTLDKQEKERVIGEMGSLEKELKQQGLNVDNVVTSGLDASEDIIETSKKSGADLMVMSTHGRSGLSRWAFGTVAEKVLRYGEIPLLLVHANAA